MTKYETITTLEQAKQALTDLAEEKEKTETTLIKVRTELAQKDKDWQELAAKFEEEVKRQVAEKIANAQPTDTSNLQDKITNLQTEKQALADKIKALENQEEQSSTWEKIQTPVIIGGGLLLIFVVWKYLSNKVSGK